jgi:hypothetical protein
MTKKQLDYDVVLAASLGDEDAMNKVIAYYGGYIATLSTRPVIGEGGNRTMAVDEVIRRQLETKLILAVMKFRAAA